MGSTIARFCFYSNMMKPTDHKMIAVEKVVCYSHFPGGGCVLCYLMQDDAAQGWSGGRSKGKPEPEPLLWFLWERISEAGSWVGLGLHSLNNFGKLWGGH